MEPGKISKIYPRIKMMRRYLISAKIVRGLGMTAIKRITLTIMTTNTMMMRMGMKVIPDHHARPRVSKQLLARDLEQAQV